MSNVINLRRKKDRSETIKKVIDGVVVEYINVDILSNNEIERHNRSKRLYEQENAARPNARHPLIKT
jgi:hypothetical protein